MLRRLINLIYAGWVPNELVSSWSCLYLETGVSAFKPIPKPSSRILQTVTAPPEHVNENETPIVVN